MTNSIRSALVILGATAALSNVALAANNPAKIRAASEEALLVLANQNLGNAEGADLALVPKGESFAVQLRNANSGETEVFVLEKEFDRSSWINLKDSQGRFIVVVGPSPEGIMLSGDEFIKQNPQLFSPRSEESANRKIKPNFFTDVKRFQNARSLGERHQLAYDSMIQWCVEVFNAIGVSNWFASDWLRIVN